MKIIHRILITTLTILIACTAAPASAFPADESPTVPGILAGIPSAREGRPGEATPIALPLKKTDVQLQMAGGLIEGEVAQVFTNNTDMALEAIYVFPLPSEATVTGMELRVGGRVIRSVVKEREE